MGAGCNILRNPPHHIAGCGIDRTRELIVVVLAGQNQFEFLEALAVRSREMSRVKSVHPFDRVPDDPVERVFVRLIHLVERLCQALLGPVELLATQLCERFVHFVERDIIGQALVRCEIRTGREAIGHQRSE